MSLPNSQLSYRDCYELMEEALEHPHGARASMGSESDAQAYRIRMNKARQLDRDRNAKAYEDGHDLHGTSRFDELTFRIREDETGNWWIYLERNQKPSVVEPIVMPA